MFKSKLNNMKIQSLIIVLLLTATTLIACNKKRRFGIFTVSKNKTTVEMDGTIGRSSLKNFNKLLKKYPSIDRIEIIECGGSSDDETNLQLSLKVHQKGINIHLLDNGEIASGGVDFFLAGIERTKGFNTKIGVHSWDSNEGSATDFEIGHSNHLPYIDYYVSIGFTQEEAEVFYYFTINAAPASSIHWMTDAEIDSYKIITN